MKTPQTICEVALLDPLKLLSPFLSILILDAEMCTISTAFLINL